MTNRKSEFKRDDLLKCSTGEMFGPGNSQLPAPNMLMMDRIVKITEDGGDFDKVYFILVIDFCSDILFFDL